MMSVECMHTFGCLLQILTGGGVWQPGVVAVNEYTSYSIFICFMDDRHVARTGWMGM